MQDNHLITLVNQAKGGDAEAFAKLIHLCTKDMYRVAYAILMNDENAADAIQDAVLTCWEKISALKEPKYFKTWMTRILIHRCYDIRKEWQRVTPLEDCGETAAELAAEDQYNLEFREALSLLNEKYRLVVILFYGEGYRTEEIAEILHIPKSTVQTRLKRAREKLANYYSQ